MRQTGNAFYSLDSSSMRLAVRPNASRDILFLICLVLLLGLSFSASANAESPDQLPLPGVDQESGVGLVPDSKGRFWLFTGARDGGVHGSGAFVRLYSPKAEVLMTAQLAGIDQFNASQAAADKNGGLWTHGEKSVFHVESSGVAHEFDLGENGFFQIEDAAVGEDGRYWLMTRAFGDDRLAIGVSPDGELKKVSLPLDSSIGGEREVIPTEDGVWFSGFSPTFESGPPGGSFAYFLPYTADTAVRVDLPDQARIVGAANGNHVWTLQEWFATNAGATFGSLSPQGEFQTIASVPSVANRALDSFFDARPLDNGTLLWSQSGVGTAFDGQGGVLKANGDFRSFKVPIDSLVLENSGSCEFGVGDKALDSSGGFWTISAGYPSRLSRSLPSGKTSVFDFGESAVNTFALGSDGSLWIVVLGPSGANLIRYDAADPPHGANENSSVAKIGKVIVRGPARTKKGEVTTYRVRVTNTGTAVAAGVRVRVSGWGVSIVRSIGKVPVGKSKVVKVRLKPRKSGRIKATFKVTSSNAGGKTVTKLITVRS